MRISNLFSKTSKNIVSDADSINAKLLTQGGFIVKQMAGVYAYLPLGLRVLEKIEGIVREEMNAFGANEILMPILSREEDYKKTGRHTMDILFKVEAKEGSKLVLNPTQEEIITPLVKKYIFSYQDLPLAIYQIQNKFRNEPRAKSGLLRCREFLMKDLYSFHCDINDLNDYYDKVKKVYFKIFKKLGLEKLTILTYSSGGDFSKYSHEFQTIADVGEDTIYLCEKCRVAVNKEIIKEHKKCPECGNPLIVQKKSIEVGNIFKLGTKFSDALSLVYKDREGREQKVEMGSYGIGISRIMGTLVEVFHDDKGKIWPETVAPYKVYLLAIGRDEVIDKANEAYDKLLKNDIEVLYDDRIKVSTGEKLADADLIGISYRVIISQKTLKKNALEVKKRNEVNSKLLSLDRLIKFLKDS